MNKKNKDISLQLEYFYSLFKNEEIDEETIKYWSPLPMYILNIKCPMMAYLYKNNFEPDVEDKFSERKVLIRTLMGKYRNITEEELSHLIDSYGLNIYPKAFIKLYEYIDYILAQNASEDKPAVLQVDKLNYFVDKNNNNVISYNNIFSIIGEECYVYYIKFLTEGHDPTTILDQIKEKLFVLANMAAAQNPEKVIKVAPIFITESDVIIPSYWSLTPEFLKQEDISPQEIVKKYMMSIIKNYPRDNDIEKFQEQVNKKQQSKFCKKYCIYKSLERC